MRCSCCIRWTVLIGSGRLSRWGVRQRHPRLHTSDELKLATAAAIASAQHFHLSFKCQMTPAQLKADHILQHISSVLQFGRSTLFLLLVQHVCKLCTAPSAQ